MTAAERSVPNGAGKTSLLSERFPHELSSGQRQLVSLAVTIGVVLIWARVRLTG